MKKWTIMIVLTFSSFYVHSQLLYQSYEKKGVVNAAGGPNSHRIEIRLKKDSSFVYQMTVYGFADMNGKPVKMRTALSEDVNAGKWFVKHDTLFLERGSTSIHSQKQLDMYLIKRKRLKRITLKGERAIFQALGGVL